MVGFADLAYRRNDATCLAGNREACPGDLGYIGPMLPSYTRWPERPPRAPVRRDPDKASDGARGFCLPRRRI